MKSVAGESFLRTGYRWIRMGLGASAFVMGLSWFFFFPEVEMRWSSSWSRELWGLASFCGVGLVFGFLCVVPAVFIRVLFPRTEVRDRYSRGWMSVSPFGLWGLWVVCLSLFLVGLVPRRVAGEFGEDTLPARWSYSLSNLFERTHFDVFLAKSRLAQQWYPLGRLFVAVPSDWLRDGGVLSSLSGYRKERTFLSAVDRGEILQVIGAQYSQEREFVSSEWLSDWKEQTAGGFDPNWLDSPVSFASWVWWSQPQLLGLGLLAFRLTGLNLLDADLFRLYGDDLSEISVVGRAVDGVSEDFAGTVVTMLGGGSWAAGSSLEMSPQGLERKMLIGARLVHVLRQLDFGLTVILPYVGDGQSGHFGYLLSDSGLIDDERGSEQRVLELERFSALPMGSEMSEGRCTFLGFPRRYMGENKFLTRGGSELGSGEHALGLDLRRKLQRVPGFWCAKRRSEGAVVLVLEGAGNGGRLDQRAWERFNGALPRKREAQTTGFLGSEGLSVESSSLSEFLNVLPLVVYEVSARREGAPGLVMREINAGQEKRALMREVSGYLSGEEIPLLDGYFDWRASDWDSYAAD